MQKLIFKREIEALRTLNVCEGIVKLRDSSTELYPFKENECYGGILMDYVPGETLDHINWNKYTQLKKYEICLQILKAVNNAHSNNVIHRDLKPSNIIYDKYADKVTLIDFGTSKIKTVMDSETTMPLYSEGYSAPELILGKNITEKCDYYSIGIIMSEILLSQKNGSDINSRIEEWTGRKEIKDILLSLVQEKPENRPESLENVIVILERLIGNLNTSSCSYSIAIDSRKLVQLKRNSIVEENMTMVQFTNSFLKNEFKQSYGYYDVKDQQYVITGEKMIMKCGYDENEQKMYVTYVGKITADRRNINIKRSFRIVGQISFVLNSRDNGYDPQDNHQLVVMFKNHQDDSFISKVLNQSQKQAVMKALNTENICLIQGPPGTGKTSVIKEIVGQIIKRDIKMTDSPKILIVSQSHTAVDNILEGLGKAIDNPLEIIRIGAERNISEEIATKYTIAAHREQLVSEIKNNVQQYVEQKK